MTTDAPATESTFLFADIAGFTALTEAHGDQEAVELATLFSRAVGELIPDGEGEVVKTVGDAVMVRMREPRAAVELATRIVDEVLPSHGYPTIRVGVHHGHAIERDGDWFGATVNVAARIAALASGGEVLVSAAVHAAADAIEGIDFECRGEHRLRNVGEPVLLYAVRTDTGDPTDRHIDPVCRMAIELGREAGTLRHDGATYRFCSLECAGKFAADPGRYLPTGAGEQA
jgi:class 3 adenylate cyclase/YHS domain-containing protein